MAIRPVNAYGPLAAAPLLSLQLAHIARSPIARLGLVYQLPRLRLAPANAALATLAPWKLPPDRLRPLGENIYIDSLLAGGVIGTPLDRLAMEPAVNPPVDPAVEAQFDVFV